MGMLLVYLVLSVYRDKTTPLEASGQTCVSLQAQTSPHRGLFLVAGRAPTPCYWNHALPMFKALTFPEPLPAYYFQLGGRRQKRYSHFTGLAAKDNWVSILCSAS